MFIYLRMLHPTNMTPAENIEAEEKSQFVTLDTSLSCSATENPAPSSRRSVY